VHADLFDEQAEELLRLLGACGCEDFVEFVGEVRRRGRRAPPCPAACAPVCGEPASEVGFLLAQGLEALTVATDAFLAERR